VYHHEFHAPKPTHSVSGEGKEERQNVCGEIDAGWDTRKRLSGGDVCEEINAGWVAENKAVWTVSGMRIWGDQRQLGHENEAVCIVSGGCM